MTEKYNILLDYLKKKEKILIAFSGGVDSTFLLKAAKDALGSNIKAITIKSPYIPDWEIEEASLFVKNLDVSYEVLDINQIDPSIINNPEDRCYLCKKMIFTKILKRAKTEGYPYVCDGSNFDDTKDYRPGMIALKELGIISPLLECGYTKEDIRKESKLLNLPTWNKPAYACLLTRLAYNVRISLEDLKRIELSEKYLMDLGFKAVRVRHHGDLARIEVDQNLRQDLFKSNLLDNIGNKLKSFGYKYVTIDVLGYTMGSFNNNLQKDVIK